MMRSLVVVLDCLMDWPSLSKIATPLSQDPEEAQPDYQKTQ